MAGVEAISPFWRRAQRELAPARVEGVDAARVGAEHRQAVADGGRELDQGAALERPRRPAGGRRDLHRRDVSVARGAAAVLGALQARVVEVDLGRALAHAGPGRGVRRRGHRHGGRAERDLGRAPLVGLRRRHHRAAAQRLHPRARDGCLGVPVDHRDGHRRRLRGRRGGRRVGRVAATAAAAREGDRRERRRDEGRGSGATRAPHARRGSLATRRPRSRPRSGR